MIPTRYAYRLSATMVACVLTSATAPAWAQSAANETIMAQTDTMQPMDRPTAAAPDVPPQSAPQPLDAQTAPSNAAPFAAINRGGENLAKNGVYLSLGYVEDVLGIISGGNKYGTAATGELYFGTVLDLQTIADIPGASFHITFDERNGFNVQTLAGTALGLEANSGPSRTTRLSEFYWEQGFMNDRIDITAGRTNPTFDFATSAISCTFVSTATCAQPGSWYLNNSNQAYPSSTWGGRVNFAATPNVYVRVGVYEDNPNQYAASQNGFNWSTTRSTGVFVPAEVGYSTSSTEALLPVKYTVGAYYDASSYTTPGGQQKHDRSSFWAQGQQTVWRPDPTTTQSVMLIGGALINTAGAPFWGQYYGGFLSQAPFGQARPNDTLAFIAGYYVSNGAFNLNKSTEWVLELNYGINIYPGVTLKPVTQYVINPDEYGFSGGKHPDHAWVVGAQVAIDFGSVLHMPQFIAH